MQPVWINVRVPADAKPGTYRGNVACACPRGDGIRCRWRSACGTSPFPSSSTWRPVSRSAPEELQQFYKLKKLPIEMYEQWIDFCLAHRISVNLCDWPDFNRDMERLVARQLDGGGFAFCLGYAWFTAGQARGPPKAQRRNHRADQEALRPGQGPGLDRRGPTSIATTRSARSNSRLPMSCTAT